MISIVSSYFNDWELFTAWWIPCIEKHKNIEFIIVDDFSQEQKLVDVDFRADNLKKFYITEDKKFNSHGARNLGVSQASRQTVFMTDIDALPTDKLIRTVVKYRGKNVMVWPFWDEHKPSRFANTPCPNEFSVLRDKFVAIKGYDEEVAQHGGWFGDYWTRSNYISVYSPQIIRKDTCYFLEEYNGDRLDHKIRDRELEARIKNFVYDRNARRDWSDKPWLSFAWERIE